MAFGEIREGHDDAFPIGVITHLRKVKKMAEENAYCPDVIHQSQAVQAALKKVDEAILARAPRRFVRRRMVARGLRWGVAGVAAAAVLLVAVTIWPGLRSVPAGREDIDGNGRVDIVDAFTLARNIEAPDGVKKEWDLNGDGVVDRTDVDTVALAAVSLKGGAF